MKRRSHLIPAKNSSGATHRLLRVVRGMTLLELLIVLAVLIALMAIALPFTLRSLEARELESTEENIASELIKARVRAQESGRPVEVIVLEMPPRVVVRYFRTDENGSSITGAEATFRGDGRSAARSQIDPVRDSWWEESALHPSVSLAAVPVANGDEASLETDASDSAGGGPVRLAVYMPDGTTLFAATLFLMHQSGLHSSLSVDPWTGQPAITRGGTQKANSPIGDEANSANRFDDDSDWDSELNGGDDGRDAPTSSEADDDLDEFGTESRR
jgi:type II secretory pathway pseudopilin PulG